MPENRPLPPQDQLERRRMVQLKKQQAAGEQRPGGGFRHRGEADIVVERPRWQQHRADRATNRIFGDGQAGDSLIDVHTFQHSPCGIEEQQW